MDITLNYAEQGAGFPLILLHGNGEDASYFERQMSYFSSTYRVIAIDTRGHGKSPRGTGPFTIDRFAEDLKEFLDGMGIQKAHILGFSDGGNIALTFALKYGNYIEKMVVNGANLYPGGVKRSVQIPICIGYGMASFMAMFHKSALWKKELLGLMVTQPDIAPEQLRTVTAQTLVLVGSRDMIKDSHSRLIADSLMHGTYCCVEGTHFIARENPDAFNRAVEQFLGENRKGQERG